METDNISIGRAGKTAVVIEDRGISVFNKARKQVVGIGSLEDGGFMSVFNKAGKGVAAIGSSESGGIMEICNTTGKGVAAISVNEDGDGMIHTYKGGWRTH